MTSQSLFYNSSSDQLSVPGAFIIHGKTISAHGKHMIFYRLNEQVDVKEGVWIEDTNPKWQGVAPQ